MPLLTTESTTVSLLTDPTVSRVPLPLCPPTIGQLIDYKQLEKLGTAEDLLKSGKMSVDDAHEYFMRQYSYIIKNRKAKELAGSSSPISTPRSRPMFRVSLNNIPPANERVCKLAVAKRDWKKQAPTPGHPLYRDLSNLHDITYHLSYLHSVQTDISAEQAFQARLRGMRKILRSLPFERTAQELDLLTSYLRQISDLKERVKPTQIASIASIATLELVRDPGTTVFGNNAFYIVLKGQMLPMSLPHLLPTVQTTLEEFRSPTPVLNSETASLHAINIGRAFGTLTVIPNRAKNSRILSATNVGPNTELLRVGVAEFSLVCQKAQQEDNNEKINLLKSCQQYKLWPKISLTEVAEIVSWLVIPCNSWIVKEGQIAPYAGMIKSGKCKVYRRIIAKHKLSNGVRVRREKQVFIGELGPGDSFGEVSIMREEWSSCSILAKTTIYLGIITAEGVNSLDPTTRSLLLQSNNPMFQDITQSEVEQKYIEQESKREWKDFKTGVVKEFLKKSEINVGIGKFYKPQTQIDEAQNFVDYENYN